jgi:hypothetical protein
MMCLYRRTQGGVNRERGRMSHAEARSARRRMRSETCAVCRGDARKWRGVSPVRNTDSVGSATRREIDKKVSREARRTRRRKRVFAPWNGRYRSMARGLPCGKERVRQASVSPDGRRRIQPLQVSAPLRDMIGNKESFLTRRREGAGVREMRGAPRNGRFRSMARGLSMSGARQASVSPDGGRESNLCGLGGSA